MYSRSTCDSTTAAERAAVACPPWLVCSPGTRTKEELLSTTHTGATETIIPTFCHGCGSYHPECGLLCHVRDGRFVRVEANPAAANNGVPGSKMLCAKGLTGPQFVYAADRLKYPMKRIGAKGEGTFQRISWDEALDTVAAKLLETKAKYGPESYGVLSPEFWPVLVTLGRRFLNVHGSPNYMHSAICATPRMAASKITIGYISMAPDDWQKHQAVRQLGRQPRELRCQPGHSAGDPQRAGERHEVRRHPPHARPAGLQGRRVDARPSGHRRRAGARVPQRADRREAVRRRVRGPVVPRLRQTGRARAAVHSRMGLPDHRPAGRADPRGRPAHRHHAPDLHPHGQRRRRPEQRRHGDGHGHQPHRGHHRQSRRARRPLRLHPRPARHVARHARQPDPARHGRTAGRAREPRLVPEDRPLGRRSHHRLLQRAHERSLRKALPAPSPQRELLQPVVGHPQPAQGGRGPEETRVHVRGRRVPCAPRRLRRHRAARLHELRTRQLLRRAAGQGRSLDLQVQPGHRAAGRSRAATGRSTSTWP